MDIRKEETPKACRIEVELEVLQAQSSNKEILLCEQAIAMEKRQEKCRITYGKDDSLEFRVTQLIQNTVDLQKKSNVLDANVLSQNRKVRKIRYSGFLTP